LPSYERTSNLKRIYTLDQDGSSLLNFYARSEEYETTFLIVKDEYDYVFGSLCMEPWECKCDFFGTN